MNLPVKKQDTNLELQKTKSIFDIAKKLLGSNSDLADDSWMQRLWDWADENEIPDLDLLAQIVYECDDGPPHYVGVFPKNTLDDGDLSSIDYEWWEGLPRDKNTLLNFSDLNITIVDVLNGIPQELFNLINLQKLSIRYDFEKMICKILDNTPPVDSNKDFIAHINKISNQKVEVENNLKRQITGIPKEIGNLTNLRELSLSNNALSALPNEIWELSSLETLNISNNEISNIPKEMANLTSLETLDISFNNLTELPDNFFFTSYKYLNLSGNNLLTLPLSLCNIEHIDKLIISNQNEDLVLDNLDLKLTQKQKLWLFEIERNGAIIEGYTSRAEGESRDYYHWMDKRIIWWDCFDVWDDFLIYPTEFLNKNIEKISFQTKGNIDIKDNFLAWADEETGLMWEVQHSNNINDEYLWKESFNYASKLNLESYAGFSDWIIPNTTMLTSILKYSETIVPVSNIHHYWSSHPFVYVDYGGSENEVADYDGYTKELRNIRNEEKLNVICVRIFNINKALLFASKHELTDMRKILLDSGADIDVATKLGHYNGSRK